MGSTNDVNLNNDKNEIFAVERINKRDYILKTNSENFDIDEKKELLINKLNILLKLSACKNSVKYIGYYEDEENINIVTEKYDMNLLEYLNNKGKLSLEEIKIIFNQLNNIFHVMLSNDIIHKVIKIENILLKLNDDNIKNPSINDFTFKLSDYGNDVLTNNKNSNIEKIGTMAPEILSGENYDNKVDLYSIGIVMYQLYFNHHPFGENFAEINNKISNNFNEFKLSGNDIFDDLLQSLLVFNPENRINWEEYFNHQFFQDNKIYNNSNIDEFLNLQYTTKKDDKDGIEDILIKKKKIEDDNNIKLINEFNTKFKNKIKIKFEEQNLKFSKKYIGNKGFELLSKIKFKQVETLYLNYNKLSNIKDLSKIKLLQLIKLDLSHNNINNINEFEFCNFSKLTDLKLNYNQINNIDILKKCNLSKLKILYLNHNKINNIDILEECDLNSLNELYLSSNQIEDISILCQCNFNKIYKLGLSENKINNIEVLGECDFEELKKLYLYGNKINNINIFSKCKFSKLNELYLYDNKINDITVFENCNFNELKELSLYNNKIENSELINKLREQNITVYY